MESRAQDKDIPALDDRWLAYLLGHPLRVRIATELGQRPLSPPELAAALSEPLPRVIYHYGVLARDGGLG